MVQPYRELHWGAHMRAFVRAALALSLVILGTHACASALVLQELRPTAATAMSSQPMPAAFDCTPCAAVCCVAPPPANHSFSGEDKPPVEHRWHVQRPPIFSAILFDIGGWHVALPVRIAFCRWLD